MVFLTQKVVEILENAKSRIQQNMSSNGINASGRTSESLRVEVYDGGVRLVAGGERVAPFFTLETGRPGGKVPKKFNSIIELWIADKGISVKQVPYKRQPSENWQPKYTVEVRSLKLAAGAIAHSIAERGTQRFREPKNYIYSPVIEDVKKQLSLSILLTIKQAIKTN